MIVRIFQFAAAALIGTAAYLYLAGDSDWAFVAGVVGMCCYFLSIRFEIKKRQHEREAAETDAAIDVD